MGSLTQDELKAEIRAALGNSTELDSRLTTILNISQTRIARLYDWNELQEIDSGSLSYTGNASTDKFHTLPASLRKIHSFRLLKGTSNISPQRLEFIQPAKWDSIIPDSEYYTVGEPTAYTIWKNRAELWKIPDAAYAYEIRYSLWPTDFDSAIGTQKSTLDHKDDLLIMLSTSWAFATLREMEEANRWFAIFKDALQKATGQDITEFERDIKPSFEIGKELGRVNPWQDPFQR